VTPAAGAAVEHVTIFLFLQGWSSWTCGYWFLGMVVVGSGGIELVI